MVQKVKPIAGWTKFWQDKKRFFFYAGGFILLVIVAINLYYLFFNQGITLTAIKPGGEISSKTNLNFMFSGDLGPVEKVGQTFAGDLIRFNPPVPGKYRWISPRELQFLPEAPFRPSTRYTLELRSDLSSGKGKPLTGDRTREFITYRFKVEEAGISFKYLSDHKKGIELEARLNFNYPVAPVELQKALKLHFEGWGKEIKYNLSPGENSTQFTLTSEPLYLTEKEQKVELNIPKGFRPVDGSLGLAEDYTKKADLGVKQELTILGVAAKTDSSNCWLSVHCSEPVEGKTVDNFIQLKPAVHFKTEVDGAYILIRSDAFEARQSYNLRITVGLPALNGNPLKREYAASGVFANLEPTLHFNSKGKYLSSKGFLNLGLETVNVSKVNLEISQVFTNNIVAFLNNLNGDGYLSSYSVPDYGRVIKSTVITVGGEENESITTPINLGDFFTDKYRGVFQVIAYDNEDRWRQDSKYVVITDLGIMAKMGRDEMLVWVNSLETLEPKTNTKVTLLSQNNQIIATGNTDNKGMVRFPELHKSMGDFQPLVILAEQEKDFSFVTLNNSLISTTDFDVNGRNSLDSGYEAFLYLDRDVFRPGDHGNLVGVIRGPSAAMPPEFPVKLVITQPDGQTFKQLQDVTGNRGACEFGFEIPDYAQTGKYHAALLVAEEAISETTFSVEDFMPERIKVTAKTDKNEYNPGEEATISIEGITLFGPPASGRRTEMRVKVEPEPFSPPGYQSYQFGDPQRKFTNIDEELGDDQLDENGQTEYTYTFPKELTPPSKLKAVFQATVLEEGGRAVSSYKTVTLNPYPMYIGIKPLVDEYGEMGKPYSIKYVLLNQQGKPVSSQNLSVEVFHINWETVERYNQENDNYTWDSVEEKTRVYNGSLSGAAGEQTYEFTPQDWGDYRIVIKDNKSSAQASLSFYATGWGYQPWAMESPEKLQLDLEQKVYKVGARARLQVKAPFSGKALVVVERGKVYDYQVVNFKQNSGTVTIPVKEEYQPNVYVSVHLIRSTKSLEKNNPVRAFGTIPLMVDCGAHNLSIQMEAPEEIRPNRAVEVQVKVANAGAQAYLTLAAVHEGICQITNYATPDPFGFFYGKKALNINSYDLYGMILPEVPPVQNKKSPGGDADQDTTRRQNLNPVSVRRVKPVSLWSGLVKLNGGVAKIKLNVPQFNGTLRLMAVASSERNFGSLQKKILVRDPIVMTPTFPRFVAPGDLFMVPVSIFNGTGSAGSFTLNINSVGPVEAVGENRASVDLKNQEEKTVRFQFKAKDASGKLTFKLAVKGNQETCEMSEDLAVRPAAPVTQEIVSGTITAKTPLKITPEDKWMLGTTDCRLTLSPFPGIKLAGSLQYLLGYPYGCVEQTTSKVLPLLYFDELAEATDTSVFKGENADLFVNQGIDKLQSMQMWDGNFAYWPGGNYCYEWGSIYASHFLIEARKAGFNVSDEVYDKILTNLIRISKEDARNQYDLQTKVYALYALSLAGKAQTSVMSYLKNYRLEDLTLYSCAQLAACYFYTGDRQTALSLLPESFAVYTRERETGGNFNSQVRADAIILGVLAEIDPSHPAIPKLVKRLSDQAEIGWWGTTQENAFALLALGKALKRRNQEGYSGEVLVGKTKIDSFNQTKALNISDRRLSQGPISVTITGGGVCYYYLKTSGVSTKSEVEEYDNGIQARREILDRYGNNISLDQVKQGDLLIVKLSIRNEQDELNNLALVDLLPGGFEIENPRLGKDNNFSWMEEDGLIAPDYLDIRDDRLLLFTSFRESGYYSFYYAVRAVTCGEFTLPPLKAECMYEPEISSISSSGQVTIKQ